MLPENSAFVGSWQLLDIGLHPTYIQEMHQDPRYQSEDIVTVIDQLGHSEGSKYNSSALGGFRQFFRGEPRGKWQPEPVIEKSG